MGNLFWKIFLWFWLTLVLIAVSVFSGTAIYIQNSDAYQQHELHERYLNNRIELLRQVIFYGGETAASYILDNERLRSNSTMIYILDDYNNEITGQPFNLYDDNLVRHESTESDDGDRYHIFSKRSPYARITLSDILRPFQRSPGIYFMWLLIAFILSGLVCFGLARYLSGPIRTLQRAAQKLSKGELDTRVTDLIGNRRDEIADLGQDFDQMAIRLQRLVNNQKQLLSDISHELRSPLARMQLAVALAQKKSGCEISSEMQRIEQETERLDDLIDQSLTLSRLDAGAVYAKEDFIDIGELLDSIIVNCDFEAKEHQKCVNLKVSRTWTVKANSELLYRALENIIRNAIRYTEVNTSVNVNLTQNDESTFCIRISDQGPGVPEDKIDSLFEPFVRLSQARDRESGGYGLGLAIAKHAVELHDGDISAINRKDNTGLTVKIVLPFDS